MEIKVILIDDDLDWIRLLKKRLMDDTEIKVVATSNSYENAVELIKTTSFDVAVIDMELIPNEFTGLELINSICCKNSKVIVLSGYEEKELILKSFQRGAVEYLNKDGYASLNYIIKESVKKDSTLNIKAENLISGLRELRNEDALLNLFKEKMLTAGEQIVCLNIWKGITSTDELADITGFTPRSVTKHTSKIMTKIWSKGADKPRHKVELHKRLRELIEQSQFSEK